MSVPLTLEEAVALGTVHLQGLLGAAGIRSLVIKGPAFVELGVRQPKRSNDIDMLVHQDDRTRATEVLAQAGWSVISHWFPPALEEIIYSTTFRHATYPATLDLHHRFSGLLAGAAAFDVLWQERTEVDVAHRPVTTVGPVHALVIEALNATKRIDAPWRRAATARVVAVAGPTDVGEVISAAEALGARHTVADLVEVLGGPPPEGPPPPGFARWQTRGSRAGGLELIADLVRLAPMQIPKVVWQQLSLTPERARFWAHAHAVDYRSPRQILWVRVRRMLGR